MLPVFALVACSLLALEEGIAMERRHKPACPSPGAKGIVDPAFDGELSCDLSHERH